MRFLRRQQGELRPADPEEATSALGALDLFASAPASVLSRLAGRSLVLMAPEGTDVIREGRMPSGFYVCLAGRLDVVSHGGGGAAAVKVNELGPGDHFGEVGLIEGMPATASVTAAEDCRILKIPGHELLGVLNESPAFVAGFVGKISEVMARTDPRYRLAADERSGRGTEAVGAAELQELARLTSELGPAIRPFGGDDLLDQIALAARRLLDAAACSIALVQDGDLVFKGVSGAGAEEVRGLVLPVDRGITGSVFTTGDAVSVEDVSADPRFDSSFASSTGFTPRSLHARRLETARGPIGVLQVLDAKAMAGERGGASLEVFAELAALTIEIDALFANLGRAVFAAAVLLLEGRGLDEALAEVSRTAPDASKMPAALLEALRSLAALDEQDRERVLQHLRDRTPGS